MQQKRRHYHQTLFILLKIDTGKHLINWGHPDMHRQAHACLHGNALSSGSSVLSHTLFLSRWYSTLLSPIDWLDDAASLPSFFFVVIEKKMSSLHAASSVFYFWTRRKQREEPYIISGDWLSESLHSINFVPWRRGRAAGGRGEECACLCLFALSDISWLARLSYWLAFGIVVAVFIVVVV